MIDRYPNPWDFNNSTPQLIAPDGVNKIEYLQLNEIAMGAPLGGSCTWNNGTKTAIEIGKWCAGPALWNSEGTMAAIPIWTKSFWKGTCQRLAILNSRTGKLTTYKKLFNVLDLRSFTNNRIYGYDSPIHKTKTVDFDLITAKIQSKKRW